MVLVGNLAGACNIHKFCTKLLLQLTLKTHPLVAGLSELLELIF